VDVGKSTFAILNLSDAPATYYFAVQAYSATGDRSLMSAELTWNTGASTQAPTLRNPGSMSSVVGQSATLQLNASDPGGLALAYSAVGLPSGLSLATGSGAIFGTPNAVA
jgi:hypothetical protein